MAIANREYVDRCLVELRNALKPVCEDAWSERYGSRWLSVVNDRLGSPVHDPSTDDPAFLLDGIIGTWDDVWRNSFSARERDWVWEIKEVRNRVYRQEKFLADDADRALGTVERLLVSLGAEEQRETVERYRDTLLLRRYMKLTEPGPVGDATTEESAQPNAESVGSNYERVGKCLDELREGLKPKCEYAWRARYGDEWLTVVNDKLSKPFRAPSTADTAFLLDGVIETWDEVWHEKHGDEVREWVSEAHRTSIRSVDVDSFDDAYRALGTIERILSRFGATKHKKRVEEHRDALLRRRYDPVQVEHHGMAVEMDGAQSETESVSEGGSEPTGAHAESATEVRDAVVGRPADTAMPEASAGSSARASKAGTEAGDDKPIGLLGEVFLSAGFGADGSRLDPDTEPEPVPPPAPETDLRAAPAAEAEKTGPAQPATPAIEKADTLEALDTVFTMEEEEPVSPYDLPGSWYVIHAYSGYEKKVKANLGTRTSSMHLEDRVFDVVIPTEKVVEIKGGRKVEVDRRMFPGYLLVRMYLDDDSWHAVRNTPGVTSFVGMGSGTRPISLSKREVERFLGLKKEAAKKAPRFRPAWEIGETVRVSSGPFADFNGVVEDINVDQQKVTVLVEIFGRDTPMELGFEDIQKQ